MVELIGNEYFATPIWHADFEESSDLNAQLAEVVDDLYKDGSRGWSEDRVGGWQSSLDMHRDPRFGPFTALIREIMSEIETFYRIDPEFELCIESCWANVLEGRHSNAFHTHAGADFAGVYYVRVPKGSGTIRFRDPRQQPGLFSPPIEKFTTYTAQAVDFFPVEGRLLLFPGWLEHEVRANDIDSDDETRISISFNLECFRKSWIEKLGL
ncbi:MAG: TIGR02466 family protein [Rhodobacter sp.]|nr:TIGR02466 family protein [Rhodobacter sp.]